MVSRMALTLLAMIGCWLTADGVHACAAAQTPSAVRLVVRVSPQAAYVTATPVPARLAKRLTSAAPTKTSVRPATDLYLEAGGRRYAVDASMRLYDPARAVVLQPPRDAAAELRALADELRERHYGRLLTWDEAKRLLGPKSIFQVIDLETGLGFRVQRRAGRTHADVQPLEKRDTDIMKRIYGQEWSWRRRAILVSDGGPAIAASMHGMPHGGDGIPDNGFRGHFCIHFLGSRTHRSGSVDFDHQIMALKAAGRLHRFLAEASPDDMVRLFVAALNQRDPELLALAYRDRNDPQFAAIVKDIPRLQALRFEENGVSSAESGEFLTADIPVRATLYRADGKGEERWILRLSRGAPWEPWRMRLVAADGAGGRWVHA